MTELERVAELMQRGFYQDFALTTAGRILDEGLVAELYAVATSQGLDWLPRGERQKVVFRAAYVLETIYFMDWRLFSPFIERFCEDFTRTESESAKRHFTKIMRDILRRGVRPNRECIDAIAQACVMWVTEPHAKVAVQIGAIEVLLALRGEVEWVGDMLPEILEPLRCKASAAIEVRLKRWSKL